MDLCPTCLGGELRREDGVLRCDDCGAAPPVGTTSAIPVVEVRGADDGAGAPPLVFPDRRRWARAGRWRAAETEFAHVLAERYALAPEDRTPGRGGAVGRVVSRDPLIHHYSVQGDDWVVHRDAVTRAAPWMAYARRDNRFTVLR